MVKTKKDITIYYGAAIYQLHAQGKPHQEIADLLGIKLRSCNRYYAEYKTGLKTNPNLQRTVEAATDKMLELTEISAKRYEEWIKSKDPKLQLIAYNSATNVLKSAKSLTDRHVTEHDLSRMPHADLISETRQLLSDIEEKATSEESDRD